MTIPSPAAGIHASDRRRFRWRGLAGGLLLGPTAVLALFSRPPFPLDSAAHMVLEALAGVVFLAGAAARFWATLYIGGRKEDAVVMDGPYSLCRNPLYVGSLLLAASAGLFLESAWFLAALAVVAIVYTRGTVPVEEGILRARHGAAFDRYAQTVPRFLPGGTLQTPRRIEVDVPSLWGECRRAARWMWLPIIGALLGHLRALPWWPVLFGR